MENISISGQKYNSIQAVDMANKIYYKKFYNFLEQKDKNDLVFNCKIEYVNYIYKSHLAKISNQSDRICLAYEILIDLVLEFEKSKNKLISNEEINRIFNYIDNGQYFFSKIQEVINEYVNSKIVYKKVIY